MVEPQQPDRADDSVGASVDAILEAARAAAQGIVVDAQRGADQTQLAAETSAERLRREAEEDAAQIRAEAQADGDRLKADAQEAANAETERLAEENSELRNQAEVLESHRDRILHELESISHRLDDAIAELRPEAAHRSLGEALKIPRRS